MKSPKNLFAGLLVSSFCLPAIAADPVIVDTWGEGVGTKPVHIYSGMPAACDNPTLYGLNVWNGANAAFAFGWPSDPITWYRESEVSVSQDNATIYVEDRNIVDVAVIMQSHIRRNSTEIVDADIFVNDDYLFYGSGGTGAFHCPASSGTATPADKMDYQSAIEHEFGHTLGFQISPLGEYYDNAACVMYYSLDNGITNRALCAGEYNEFRLQYGVR